MTEKTSQKKRRKYDADFKAEVLKMVASGKPVSEISQALGIGENLVYRWKSKQRLSSIAGTKGKKEVDVWQEVDQLREKLRQTELERDIWTSRRAPASGPKKALAIFSRMT